MVFNDPSFLDRAGAGKRDLPPLSQIGLTVPDLSRGARYYSSLLGVGKWYRTMITGAEYYYHGRPLNLRLDIAVGYSGGLQIELIEHHSEAENIYNAPTAPRGFGLHHLGFSVSDLDARLDLLRLKGVMPLQTGTIRFGRGGVTRFAYLDTMEQAGFVLELIETRAFGIYLGMPRWLVNLGRLTGDTKLLI
jgi:catechol 2,3-dioxygenase-like lactoylglutathione lyase family enzyme